MDLKVVSGSANPAFAAALGAELSKLMGEPVLVPIITTSFNDGEKCAQFPENIRRGDVFIVQPTNQPDGNLMELLVMCDAAKRASAGDITAVMPYFGYGRQDRKVKPRVPITAKLVCDLLATAGAQRLLAADLHAGQIQGFFDGPFDNLEAFPVLLQQIRADFALTEFVELAFISPDDGGLERARETGKLVQCGNVSFVLKSRPEPGKAIVHGVRDPDIVKGRDCLLVDDMADTVGTLEKAANALRDASAKRIIAVSIHPILSFDKKANEHAIDRLERSPIERLYVSDSVAIPRMSPKLRVVSIAPLFARAIRAIHEGQSVHRLFGESCDAILASGS